MSTLDKIGLVVGGAWLWLFVAWILLEEQGDRTRWPDALLLAPFGAAYILCEYPIRFLCVMWRHRPQIRIRKDER